MIAHRRRENVCAYYYYLLFWLNAFGFQVMKQRVGADGKDVTFLERVMIAGVAGACGGLVGTPGDMINVRMQNDVKLPLIERRKSVISPSVIMN